jgi:hypothetical protein
VGDRRPQYRSRLLLRRPPLAGLARGGALGDEGVVYRWNGRAWRSVPLPALGGTATFGGVDAIGPGDVWVVGEWKRRAPHDAWPPVLPLFLHWDGRSWSVRHPALFPDYGFTELTDVTWSPAADGVLAVGRATKYHPGRGTENVNFSATLTGTSWAASQVSTDYSDGLWVASGDWAVGGSQHVPNRPATRSSPRRWHSTPTNWARRGGRQHRRPP